MSTTTRSALALVALMLVLSAIERFGLAAGAPLALVDAAAVSFFLILAAAPLAIVPIGYATGERAAKRIGLSLLPALWWWTTEVAFHLQTHSLPESIFLTGFITNYAHLQLLGLEIVVAEIGCRAISRIRTGTTPVFTKPLAIAALTVVVAASLNTVVLPGYYGGFQNTYRALFMQDQLPAPRIAAGGPIEPIIPTTDQPNIVVILSDDHRWDYLGSSGHAFVQTPHLDRLAREGVRFEQAFVTSSLCSPSRGSFLTGLYPHRHGVFNNFTPWNNDNRTFFEYLEAAGYDTAFIGKWHMPGGLPELRGVNEFVTFTAVGGQGQYFDCPLIVNGREEPSRKRYLAEELTDRAIEFVERERQQPFILYLSHKNVHAPFYPAPEEAGNYADANIDLPPGAHSWTAMVDAQYNHLSPFRLQPMVRRYAEAITSMDREIGRLLAALDELGIAERTVVIYASDNGYLWGEHRFIDKRWPHEASIRVPLLVRAPGIAPEGESRRQMALNIDLAPTLLDLAAVEIPKAMQGVSLVPVLRSPRAPTRDAFYYNYYYEPPFPVPTTHAIRTDRYKYVEYPEAEPALYDLEADPGETNNLVESSPHSGVLEELRHRLAELRAAASVPRGRATPVPR